jgi:hypothetical protein
MSPSVARLKEEFRKGLITAVFFSIGFLVIMAHNRLLTAGTGFQPEGFAKAIIGGLIVAKILLSVDMLPFVDVFPHRPTIYNIGWKTSLYVAAGVVFLYADPFVRHLVKGAGLYESHSQAWHELMLPRTWATVIWVVVLMLIFVTVKETSRVIGKDRLKHVYFGRRDAPVTEIRRRDAA